MELFLKSKTFYVRMVPRIIAHTLTSVTLNLRRNWTKGGGNDNVMDRLSFVHYLRSVQRKSPELELLEPSSTLLKA